MATTREGVVRRRVGSRQPVGVVGVLTASAVIAGLGGYVRAVETIQLSSLAVPGSPAGYTVSGFREFGELGSTAAGAGDVNGDGYGDYIVGAPNSGYTGVDGSGRAFVVFGGTTAPYPGLEGLNSRGFSIAGAQAGAGLGASVAGAGDINGDGLADIIVGAPGASSGGRAYSGEAYVLFGNASPFSRNIAFIETGDPDFDIPPNGFRIRGASANDRAGISVSGIGDINGDYLADVVVGAHFADPGGISNAGSAYVIFGKSSFSPIDLFQLGTQGFRIDGAGTEHIFGASVAGAGDVNGDGIGDILAGAQGFDLPGLEDVGAAYVIFGKSDLATVSVANLGARGIAIQGSQLKSRLGFRVAGAGDVNADGRDDVALATFEPDTIANPRAGRTHVVFGRSASGPISLSSLGDGGFEIVGSHPDNVLGTSVSSAGDVNGDGLADLVLGGPLLDRIPNSVEHRDTGGGWLVLGRTGSGPVNVATAGNDVFRILGVDLEDYAGTDVAGVGDSNGDGLPDIVMGAPFADRLNYSGYPLLANTGEFYLVSSPYSQPPRAPQATATFRTFIAGSYSPFHAGVGRRPWGDDSSIVPDSRLALSFAGGTGPGINGASLCTVTLERGNAALPGYPAQHVGNTRWRIESDRVGATEKWVHLHYTPADLGNLPANRVRLIWAPSIDGPFQPVEFQMWNTSTRRIEAVLPSLPAVVAFANDLEGPTPTVELRTASPTANQVLRWVIVWDEPLMAGTFTEADLEFGGTAPTADRLVRFVDNGYWQEVVVALSGEYVQGSVTLGVAAGAAYDQFGNPSRPSPDVSTCVVGEAVLGNGDANGDGRINTADITTLGNFIVNGTPLP